jgi:hypothetical protein
MKSVGPPPVFKQELRNEKIKIGDKITLTCQGEDCLKQKVITNFVEQNHLLLKKLRAFYGGRILSFSQELAIGPQPESVGSSPHPHIRLMKINFDIFPVLQLG